MRAWGLALIVGVLVPAVGGSVLGLWSPWLAIALPSLGAGAALALLYIPEVSVLLWLGVSAVYGIGVLLLHTLARAAVPAIGAQPFLLSLSVFGTLLGAGAAALLSKGKRSRTLFWFTRGDVIFLVMCVPVLASALLVASRNGYATGPDGRDAFHARGFVNGDTMTLFALTQASGSRHPDSGLLRANPFAGNGPLEYPTLVHRTLADVMAAIGGDITRDAWWLILPALVGTVAASVLSLKVLLRDQTRPWWAALVGLAALGTTWESFTYPQSHTFLTGLFFLFLLLLVLRDQSGHALERRGLRFAIGALALVLLFSNAVLGTAAVAIAVGSNVLQFFNRTWPLRDRLSGLIGSGILVTLFLLFPPGQGSLGTFNAAYTAIPQFLVAAVPALVVLWALWDTAWLHRSPSLLAAAVVLPALGLLTLFFSGRDIVAENSPRFLFLLVLVGWPTVVPLLQRIADWWWRQVKHVEHTLAEHVVLWGGGTVVLVVVVLPTVASVLGTLDHLVRKPPLVVSADELGAFAWIRQNTPTDAVFLRAPESLFENPSVAPLSLPAFTGRAQLRSEYWLSPNDDALENVRQFFVNAGPPPPGASYLYCGPEMFVCPAAGAPIFSTGEISIRGL